MIPDNARPIRITAAAGTYLAGASSAGTVDVFPAESGLQPEGLHPARGVAASGFPPLRKIPHCCLPEESGPCLSPNVAGRSLNPATHRRLGGPSPRLLPDGPRPHPMPPGLSRRGHGASPEYPVLAAVSSGCPGAWGRLVTCYSPVRHSMTARRRVNRSTCMC